MSARTEEEWKALSQDTLRQGPAISGTYRHYKGGLYEVVCVSIQEDTLVPLVTYRSLERGYFWTRTLENWNATVRDPETGKGVPRFTPAPGDTIS
jgi:hypothetical protein